MQLTGQTHINAQQQAVWDALNDPAILSQCIDGCQKLERIGDNRFEGAVVAKVGPVKATFQGIVTLTELDPPNTYVLLGEGKGGIAGFVKGGGRVALTPADNGVNLTYTADAAVGGKLAQLGARLIEATARDYAQKFFTRFKALVEAGGTASDETIITPLLQPQPQPRTDPAGKGLPVWVWGGGLILLCAALIVFLSRS